MLRKACSAPCPWLNPSYRSTPLTLHSTAPLCLGLIRLVARAGTMATPCPF